MEWDLTWGGEHTIQNIDEILWNYTSEAYVNVLTKVTQLN